MSSPEVAEPKVLSVSMVPKLAPLCWGSSWLSPGVGWNLELPSPPGTVGGEGGLREEGNWLRGTLMGSGSEEVSLGLRETLRGGMGGLSNE